MHRGSGATAQGTAASKVLWISTLFVAPFSCISMSDSSEPSPGFDIQLSAGLSAELTSSPDAALHGRESLALAEDRTAGNVIFQAQVAIATALSSAVPRHGIARFRRFKHDDSVNSVCYHPNYPSFGLLATGSSTLPLAKKS